MKHRAGYYDIYIKEPSVDKNVFRGRTALQDLPPEFTEIKSQLPHPFWQNHETEISAYWKAWEIAFSNIKPAQPNLHFIRPFIDSAFNECLFMWDSVFIMQYAKYGINAFDFFQTLDNFYCRQHDDGFICREIKEWDGLDRFHRFDHASTGPNILAFAEWEHYKFTQCKERLVEVFPVLLGYHRWLRKYRTWPDGSYWTTGWACGMDNQPRTSSPLEWIYYHDSQTWVDANLQALLSCELIEKIGYETGIDAHEFSDITNEKLFLSHFINNTLWDKNASFFKDRKKDGTLSSIKTIGAFWCLHIDSIDPEHIYKMIQSLDNPGQFKRTHSVPSLSADDAHFKPDGGYWQGSVWPPTNYMITQGLKKQKEFKLAEEIALNHYVNVLDVYKQTSTFWENYAPDHALPGSKSKKDFVGWSGLAPIAHLIEDTFGIKLDLQNNSITWNIKHTENFGIVNLPFGTKGLISLECPARRDTLTRPDIKITTNLKLSITVTWTNGTHTIQT